MKITVIGSGYVGLVVGTCLADSGNDVACVDVDKAKIDALNAGQVPIYEPGLEELLHRGVREHRLTFSTNVSAAVAQSEVVFIAVGTPEGEDGDADLKHVLAAAKDVGRALARYTVIIDKSTVPVGTADQVREVVAKETQQEFDVVSNPEFLKEGAAVEDFMKPDRVVIGANSERARKVMAEVYAPFVRTGNPILFTDTRSAELTKYAANAMLATRISFMNEIAGLCEKVGADVESVRKGIGLDKRIGMPFLFPGIGFGGSCFPKDIRALASTARDSGLEFELLRAVDRINERQKKLLLAKAQKHYGELAGKCFAVWGLAFKPKTDDMREAPAITVVEGLVGKGAKVRAHDPVAGHSAQKLFGDRVTLCDNPYSALEDADGLFIITEWNEFRHPDFERMKKLMKQPVVFDGRNLFDPTTMRERGFKYFGVGRGTAVGSGET
jgi:UDPglucose 6-dehydrogenase